MLNMYYAIFRVMSIGPASSRQNCAAGPHFRRGWIDDAVAAIEADQRRTADTHLIRLIVPALSGIHIYLKDESTHPTGSLSRAGETGSLVTLICDSGERYRQTYYESEWLAARGIDPAPFMAELTAFLET